MLKRVNVVLAILVVGALVARLLTPLFPMTVTFSVEGVVGLVILWWRHRKKGRRPASLSKLRQQDIELQQRREAIRTRATPFIEDTGPAMGQQAPAPVTVNKPPVPRRTPLRTPVATKPVLPASQSPKVAPMAAAQPPALKPLTRTYQPVTSRPRPQARPALQSDQLYGRLRRPAPKRHQLDRQVLSRPSSV